MDQPNVGPAGLPGQSWDDLQSEPIALKLKIKGLREELAQDRSVLHPAARVFLDFSEYVVR